MTNPDQGSDPKFAPSTRRAFLAAGGVLAATAMLAAFRRRIPAQTMTETEITPMTDVLIVEFGADGKNLGAKKVPKVVKTDAEWRTQLSPESYIVTRQEGTERAFTGQYDEFKDVGIYRCIRLRYRAVQLRQQVRFGHRMAELLAADRERECAGDAVHRLWCAGGDQVQAM